jgi:hypothetical protein
MELFIMQFPAALGQLIPNTVLSTLFPVLYSQRKSPSAQWIADWKVPDTVQK